MSKATFEDVKAWMRDLAVAYPKLLNIPGTMSWIEKIDSTMINSTLRQLDIMASNLASYKCVPAFNINEEKEKVRVGGSIIRNTAIVAYHSVSNSSRVITYDKKSNFHDNVNGEVFWPGTNPGSILWCPNERGQLPCFRVGLEICFDHNTDQFKTGMKTAKTDNIYMRHPDKLAEGQCSHIHIVLSDHVPLADVSKLQSHKVNDSNIIHSSTVYGNEGKAILGRFSKKPSVSIIGRAEVISKIDVDYYIINC